MNASIKTEEEFSKSISRQSEASDTASTTVGTALFSPVDGKNVYRPYTSGLIENEPCGTTLILVKSPSLYPGFERAIDVDYLKNLTIQINPPDASSNQEDIIPVLKELNDSPKNEFLGIFKTFSILRVRESRQEISQVVLNFGNRWNAYFFGNYPKMYSIAGVFIDAQNYPYYEQFMLAYDNYLGGGKCAENGFRMYFVYDNKIISGWLLSVTIGYESSDPFSKSFEFVILVEDEGFFRIKYGYDKDGNVIGVGSGKNYMTNQYMIPGINQNL